MTGRLYTIGYEGAGTADLVATLRGAGVTTVIDVRAVPWSRQPAFRKRDLQRAFAEAGIDYVHLAGLGNPKEGREAAKAGDLLEYERIFRARMALPDFTQALDRAARLAGQQTVCLLCLERDQQDCHRRFVAEALGGRTGLTVTPLVPDRRGQIPLF